MVMVEAFGGLGLESSQLVKGRRTTEVNRRKWWKHLKGHRVGRGQELLIKYIGECLRSTKRLKRLKDRVKRRECEDASVNGLSSA